MMRGAKRGGLREEQRGRGGYRGARYGDEGKQEEGISPGTEGEEIVSPGAYRGRGGYRGGRGRYDRERGGDANVFFRNQNVEGGEGKPQYGDEERPPRKFYK